MCNQHGNSLRYLLEEGDDVVEHTEENVLASFIQSNNMKICIQYDRGTSGSPHTK